MTAERISALLDAEHALAEQWVIERYGTRPESNYDIVADHELAGKLMPLLAELADDATWMHDAMHGPTKSENCNGGPLCNLGAALAAIEKLLQEDQRRP